jgi:hypothetical protein
MHPIKTLVPAFAALAVFAACNNGQPRLYKVAVDMSPLSPVTDSTCYFDNTAPNVAVTTTDLRTEQQWVVWDANDSDGKPLEYLDPGEQKARMGNSPSIDFHDTIETTTQGTFTGTVRSTQAFGMEYTETRQGTLTVAFSDQGASPTGTLTFRSEYDCTSGMQACPADNPSSDYHSCSVTLNFTARRIDASRIDGYTDVGTSGSSSSLSPGTGSSVGGGT